MKLLVRVMGCGQSKSASSTVKDDHNNHDDHVEVYTKTASKTHSILYLYSLTLSVRGPNLDVTTCDATDEQFVIFILTLPL